MEDGAEHTCLGYPAVVETVVVALLLRVADHARAGIQEKLVAPADSGIVAIPIVGGIDMVVGIEAVVDHGMIVMAAPIRDGIVGHAVARGILKVAGIVGSEGIGQSLVEMGEEAAGHVVVAEDIVSLLREVHLLVEIVAAGGRPPM